ncbi:MAG: hypothetical protein KAT32_00450 [Candidatus Moranbacteria bacterium]|nr:hypothetical protein [Candidatus Moranbacteria bacterium]
MEENNQLEKQEIKRPWQGNVLLFIEVFVTFIILAILIFQLSNYFYNFETLSDFIIARTFSVGIFLNFIPDFLLYNYLNFISELHIVIFSVFLNLLFIIGFLNRKKWSIYLIFIIEILTLTVFIFDPYSIEYPIEIELRVIYSLVEFFILYLSITCLKHLFYNQKKVEQKS